MKYNDHKIWLSYLRKNLSRRKVTVIESKHIYLSNVAVVVVTGKDYTISVNTHTYDTPAAILTEIKSRIAAIRDLK